MSRAAPRPLVFGDTPCACGAIRAAEPPSPPGAHSMILLRTHYIDAAVEAFSARLGEQTGWPIRFALDQIRSDGPPDDGQVRITRALLDDLSLYVTNDAMWRCGDYALYAARRQYPQVRFFWMIEPDVRLNLRDFGDFFQLFARHTEFDLLATFLGPAGPEYPWTAMMAPFRAATWRCMFPLVRLSASALDHLLLRRQVISRQFASPHDADGRSHAPEMWPNDEVFTATELHAAGYRCADFNCTGIEFYDDRTFSYDRPVSARRFASLRMDGKIYHPVLAAEAYVRKLRGMLGHLRNTGGPAPLIGGLFDRPQLYEDIGLECGAEESGRFAAEVSAAIAAVGGS